MRHKGQRGRDANYLADAYALYIYMYISQSYLHVHLYNRLCSTHVEAPQSMVRCCPRWLEATESVKSVPSSLFGTIPVQCHEPGVTILDHHHWLGIPCAVPWARCQLPVPSLFVVLAVQYNEPGVNSCAENNRLSWSLSSTMSEVSTSCILVIFFHVCQVPSLPYMSCCTVCKVTVLSSLHVIFTGPSSLLVMYLYHHPPVSHYCTITMLSCQLTITMISNSTKGHHCLSSHLKLGWVRVSVTYEN